MLVMIMMIMIMMLMMIMSVIMIMITMVMMMTTYSLTLSFSLYYVCVFGGPLLESCTGGLVYRYMYTYYVKGWCKN